MTLLDFPIYNTMSLCSSTLSASTNHQLVLQPLGAWRVAPRPSLVSRGLRRPMWGARQPAVTPRIPEAFERALNTKPRWCGQRRGLASIFSKKQETGLYYTILMMFMTKLNTSFTKGFWTRSVWRWGACKCLSRGCRSEWSMKEAPADARDLFGAFGKRTRPVGDWFSFKNIQKHLEWT